MNSWTIGFNNGISLEPYNMTWDPRLRVRVFNGRDFAATSLEADEVIALRDALQAFIDMTSKPKEQS